MESEISMNYKKSHGVMINRGVRAKQVYVFLYLYILRPFIALTPDFIYYSIPEKCAFWYPKLCYIYIMKNVWIFFSN